MKLDHLIIGMGRCGTTSLCAYIEQHPGINTSPIKEVHYFSIQELYEQGEEYLSQHFEKAAGITSTADTYLLLSEEAPARIKAHNPQIKLTVLLRDPASRTYSNYHYAINNGYDKSGVSFIESLEHERQFLDEGIILKNNLCHWEGSLYHKLLNNWLAHFPKEQICVLRTMDLINAPQLVMDRLCEHLGLEKIEIYPLEKQNAAKQVKSRSVQQFLLNRDHWLRKVVRVPLKIRFFKKLVLKSGVNDGLHRINKKDGEGYPPMTPEERAFCENYFREDLKRLQEDFGITLK